MVTRMWAVAFLLFALLSSPSYAAFDKGGVSGIGARPLGMGGAFSTIADSGDAVFYNPAGLIQILRPEISGMGAVLLNGKEDLFDLSYVQPFGDQLAWALSTQQLFFTDGSENERIYLGTFEAPLAIDKSISFGFNIKLYTSLKNQNSVPKRRNLLSASENLGSEIWSKSSAVMFRTLNK